MPEQQQEVDLAILKKLAGDHPASRPFAYVAGSSGSSADEISSAIGQPLPKVIGRLRALCNRDAVYPREDHFPLRTYRITNVGMKLLQEAADEQAG